MAEALLEMKLQDARAQLRLSQKALAKKAKVSQTTVNYCEQGNTIRLTTAYALLEAINEVRQERSLPALKLSDIEWEVQQK